MEDFVIEGTVIGFTGKKGKVELLDTNIDGNARVMVRMVNEKGEKQMAYLSTTLGNQLRKKEITLGTIMTLSYTRSENDNLIIVRPVGTWKTYDVADLDIKEMKMETINIEELIAL